MSVPPIKNGISSAIQSNIAAANNAGSSGAASTSIGSAIQGVDIPTAQIAEVGGTFAGSIFGAKNFGETMQDNLHGGLLHSIAGSGLSSIGEIAKADLASGLKTPAGGVGDIIASATPGISTGKGG